MSEQKTIVADPPWNESGGGKIKRGADRHYPLLKTHQIIREINRCPIYNPDPLGCHLYLWVTNNFLRDGLKVMDALGFRYITNLVWAKSSFGLGQYFRGQHEVCLFGVMGRQMTSTKSESTLIKGIKAEHSKKPEEFYRLVEASSPSPRLELFARVKRNGWDSWGNEV